MTRYGYMAFVIWFDDDALTPFLEHFNSIHSGIKFTVEQKSNGELNRAQMIRIKALGRHLLNPQKINCWNNARIIYMRETVNSNQETALGYCFLKTLLITLAVCWLAIIWRHLNSQLNIFKTLHSQRLTRALTNRCLQKYLFMWHSLCWSYQTGYQLEQFTVAEHVGKEGSYIVWYPAEQEPNANWTLSFPLPMD